MKLPAAVILTLGAVSAIALAAAVAVVAPAVQVAGATASNPVDKISMEPYVLTWQKDLRYRGRDPFQTVLHEVGGPAGKRASTIAIPRTPGEEALFAEKALSLVKEADAALSQADYRAVKDRLDTLHQMMPISLITQPAKDKMGIVAVQLADLETRYAGIRARAALTEALQLAALMQGYFDGARYGDVITTEDKVRALDTPEGLQHPDVASTGAEVLKKVAALKLRAQIHVEFEKKALKVDALSHYPGGRSYAIVNGEVYAEGVAFAPDLSVARVDDDKVTFDFKGEEIPLGLDQ